MNISILEEDLAKLLNENSHLRKQITELQIRGTELIQENRDQRSEIKKLLHKD